MIALLVYSLPREKEEYEQAMRGWRSEAVLSEITRKLREQIKYAEIPDAQREAFEKVREWIAEACDEMQIDYP